MLVSPYQACLRRHRHSRCSGLRWKLAIESERSPRRAEGNQHNGCQSHGQSCELPPIRTASLAVVILSVCCRQSYSRCVRHGLHNACVQFRRKVRSLIVASKHISRVHSFPHPAFYLFVTPLVNVRFEFLFPLFVMVSSLRASLPMLLHFALDFYHNIDDILLIGRPLYPQSVACCRSL